MGGKARVAARARVSLAVSKGRLLAPTVEVFRRAGYDLSPLLGKTRQLFHDCGDLRVFVVRATDVPTYVSHGAADLGVAGRDVVDEAECDLYTPVDLGIGPCRLVLAGLNTPAPRSAEHVRIATKYPKLARAYAYRKSLHAHIVKLSGAIELAPLIGLADYVVDLVETGSTLRENGLVELETILHVTSLLLVSPARLKLAGEPVREIIEKLAHTVG